MCGHIYIGNASDQKMSPRQWDPYKLDEPLQKWDEQYITLVEKNPQLEYLTFSDINNEVSDVNVSESLHTYSNSGSPSPFFSLEDAVDKLLTVNSQCLFTMGNTIPCHKMAISFTYLIHTFGVTLERWHQMV